MGGSIMRGTIYKAMVPVVQSGLQMDKLLLVKEGVPA